MPSYGYIKLAFSLYGNMTTYVDKMRTITPTQSPFYI